MVLLIDEIDKADIEFPNDLLQELDRMEFFVYETGETVKAKYRPVIVITSNNEKEPARRIPAPLLLPLHQLPRSRNDAGDRRRTIPRSRRNWSRKRWTSSSTCAKCRV